MSMSYYRVLDIVANLDPHEDDVLMNDDPEFLTATPSSSSGYPREAVHHNDIGKGRSPRMLISPFFFSCFCAVCGTSCSGRTYVRHAVCTVDFSPSSSTAVLSQPNAL